MPADQKPGAQKAGSQKTGSPVKSAMDQDARWLPSHECCSWQYRRHVVISLPEGQDNPKPHLVVLYMSLVPRWQYAKQIGRRCDERFWVWH